MFSPSIFGQIIKLLPRDLVAKSVERHQSDKGSKKFKSWTHLITIIGAHLNGAQSLRDICTYLQCHPAQQYHLQLKSVGSSTLSDANKGRSALVFRDIAQALMKQLQCGRRHKQEMLTILDSSPIIVQGRGMEWADQNRIRNGNQGLKLHLLIKDGLPAYINLSGYRENDITHAQNHLPLESGNIYVFDKGYCDYNWWHSILEAGSEFVTRPKKNAAYDIIENKSVHGESILSDQVIRLRIKTQRGKENLLYNKPLRLIRIPHPGHKQTPFYIVSSMLDASAQDIARAYKERWQIELLFKWLKQNLKIKHFMAQNQNGIAIQIYCALIAYMLLQMFHQLAPIKGITRLKDLLFYVRGNLFMRPSYRQHQAPKPPDCYQMELWGS